MKKRFKGFTLVECIVALAILAIASLTMAEIYAVVAQRNKENHFTNTSLSNQMAYVEKYTGSAARKITTAYTSPAAPYPKPPHKGGGKSYVAITDSSGSELYSVPVDIYVLFSRDTHNQASTTESGGSYSANASYSGVFSEDDYNLRYKYLLVQ